MFTKPLYVVCVFNVHTDEPDEPGETPAQRDERKRTDHCAAFSPGAAEKIAWSRFHKSSDHHWTSPALVGEFPTKSDEDGYEVADVATLTCPFCGQTF